MKRHNFVFMLIIYFLLFVFFLSIPVKSYEINKDSTTLENKYTILVDLHELKLFLINESTKEIIKEYPVAGGKCSTPSPIGTWKIIGRAVNWGAGFGTRWMALSVPWGRYGIHGTNKPLTIGGAESLGCIRMLNKDVEDLYNRVGYGTTVVIYGGPYGLFINSFRTLTPGKRGADVYEVQRKLKNLGYYPWDLDGIYGDKMKKQVIKYRKDNKLSITHDINSEFYNKIGMRPFE